MREEVGALDGRNAADHAGHGVPYVHRAAQLHLVHERHQLFGEPRERVAALPLVAGVRGARHVPVEEEHLHRPHMVDACMHRSDRDQLSLQ